MGEGKNDLDIRLFNFAINTIKFLRTQPVSTEINVIKYQLTKSATSSGANYEEAQAGSSKLDFINKIRISLREMRESNYWLRILKGIGTEDNSEIENLIQESKELKLILGAIVQKARNNK
ncbi:MAG: four helix bundle protein [Saprospiraceae bacterium]|nr:four helix bundle protein [Saprospiraceae bacterium]